MLLAITCFGYGLDYDEKLLDMISKENHGEFYFVENEESLKTIMTDQLGKCFSIIGYDL